MPILKSSVRPHILSWLQRDPAAGIQPFVFTPNLDGRSAKHNSSLITRACLASTTSDFLLVDKTRRRGILAWTTAIFMGVVCGLPYRTLLFTGIVCMTWPLEDSKALSLDNGTATVGIENTAAR